MHNLWQAIKRQFKQKPSLSILNYFLGLLTAATEIAYLYSFNSLLNNLETISAGNTNLDNALVLSCIIFAVIFLFRDVLNAVFNYYLDKLHIRTRANLSVDLYTEVSSYKAIDFERADFLDALQKALAAIEPLSNLGTTLSTLVFSSIGTILFILIYLGQIHILLALIVLIAVIPYAFSLAYENRSASKYYDVRARIQRKMTKYQEALTSREYFKETRQQDATTYFQNKYKASASEYEKASKSYYSKLLSEESMLATVDLLKIILYGVVIFYLVSQKLMDVADIATTMLAIQTIERNMSDIFYNRLQVVTSLMPSIKNYNYIVEK